MTVKWLGIFLWFVAGSALAQGFDQSHKAWDALLWSLNDARK